ncbi:hypothetical protein QFZ28_000178 [Neobacillus niacini]|uniref:hypothetical protein n=1 Tax=Neobacillus niacini TaxID=86668 RepID=UPI002780AC7E|nr:hypothetical protein [Neobacillus niacini]MDQ0999778.1 hypothetical protein [Neobacillus niacini]
MWQQFKKSLLIIKIKTNWHFLLSRAKFRKAFIPAICGLVALFYLITGLLPEFSNSTKIPTLITSFVFRYILFLIPASVTLYVFTYRERKEAFYNSTKSNHVTDLFYRQLSISLLSLFLIILYVFSPLNSNNHGLFIIILSFIALFLVTYYGVVLFSSINFTSFMSRLNGMSKKKTQLLIDSLNIAYPERQHTLYTEYKEEEIFIDEHVKEGYYYKSYIKVDPSDFIEELCTIIESEYQLLHSNLKKSSQTSISDSYNLIHKNADDIFQNIINFSSNDKTNELVGLIMNSEKGFKLIVYLYQTLIFRIKELINESNKESFTKLNKEFIQSLFNFTPTYLIADSKENFKPNVNEKLEEYEEQLMNIFFGAIFDLFISSIKNDNLEFSYILEEYYNVVKSKIDIEVATGEDSIEKFTKKLHDLEISLAAWATTHDELKVLTETIIVILRNTNNKKNEPKDERVNTQAKIGKVDFTTAISNLSEKNQSKANKHKESYLRNLLYLMIKGHELGYYEIVGYLVKVTCSNFNSKDILDQLGEIYKTDMLKTRENMEKITKDHGFYHYILHEFSFEHCFKKTFTLIKIHLEDEDTRGVFTQNDNVFRNDKELTYFEGKVLAAGKDYGMLSVNRLVDIRKAEASKEKDPVGADSN